MKAILNKIRSILHNDNDIMATKQQTNVIGYFNPNDYPIELSLSQHNTVIRLDPKKYIVDRTGQLVNDPLLNAYVGKGRLARASDPKQLVDVVLLRPVNPTPTEHAQPTAFSHSVSQATAFDVKNGRVSPRMPSPSVIAPAANPPPVSYNPVKAYSIEDAKRLKLIRPTRPVPEDFGAEETTGAPKSGSDIPEIRYATDTQRGRKPQPLPAELAQPATPSQVATIAALERAAKSNIEDPNVLSQTARVAITEALPAPPVALLPTSGPIPGLPKPVLRDDAAPVQPKRAGAPPIPKNPQPTQMIELPAAEVEEEEGGLVVEEDLPEQAAATVPPPPAEEDNGISCPKCSQRKPFSNLGLYKRHVNRFHNDQAAEMLAPFGGA